MELTRFCKITGCDEVMEIEINPEKLERWDNTPVDTRTHIQFFFPELTADEREFILTGTPPEVWDNMEFYECD